MKLHSIFRPLDFLVWRKVRRYYVAFFSSPEPNKSVTSWIIMTTDKNLDSAEDLNAFIEILEKKRGCSVVIYNWKLLRA